MLKIVNRGEIILIEFTIKTELNSGDEFKKMLQSKIREFNNITSIYHSEVRKEGAVKTISLRVDDEEGNLIGGLYAEVYWDWLEIDYLWVLQEHRLKGLGAQLLLQAEKISKDLGCGKVFLTTFSFQAKDFYLRHGYKIVGTLDGYPPGSTYYWISKTY